MHRLPDWQTRLQALVATRQQAAFVWGQHDCFVFALDAVEAITGKPCGAEYRTYATEQGAARLVRRHGGMAAGGDLCFGDRIMPLLAQVGDVGLVMNQERECFAVCGGAHWLAAGLHGLQTLPIGAALVAWRAC